MNPRIPTTEEKEQLVTYLWRTQYRDLIEEDRVQQRDFVDTAAIAVFDSYITDGPGYAGKIMMVVWSGSPDLHEVYMWSRGQIELCAREG